MIEYLTRKPLPLPRAITSAKAPAEGEGTLTTNLAAGVLFLEHEQGLSLRLSWTEDEPGDERHRALPAGDYRLRTYRMERTQDGQLWHVSATAPRIQRVTIEAGENTQLTLDEGVKITSRARGRRAQMSITGQKGAGLTIYRDSVRIPIDYRFVNEQGEPLASGSMTYG